MGNLKTNQKNKKTNKSVVDKVLITTFFLAIMLMIKPIVTTAQTKYRVHEDIVKLSKVSEYEGIVKELIALAKKHNIQDVSWITLNTINSHYSYVQPINSFADLDKPSFVATLIEKEGKDIIKDLFNKMDQCYDTELDYILNLDKELTYMPNGFTQTPKGKNYRKNHLLYVSPGNRALVRENMKAVKELFKRKGSKEYYRVYRSGFGANGEYYMVAIAAKDELDYARQSKENDELLGDEGKKVLGDLFSNLLKYDVLLGYIRPDLAYKPEKK